MSFIPSGISKNLLSCELNISKTERMFFRYSVRAFPITDESDQWLGVVSYHDIKGIKPRLD